MAADSTVSLASLLQKDGVHFLNSAYESLFHRPLDADGRRTYCALLRAGFSKTHILHNLVKSQEGRGLGLSLPGLTLRVWMERLLPPPFVRRALGLHVPDAASALVLADVDDLRASLQALEASHRQANEGGRFRRALALTQRHQARERQRCWPRSCTTLGSPTALRMSCTGLSRNCLNRFDTTRLRPGKLLIWRI